jgi:hypothetical protein
MDVKSLTQALVEPAITARVRDLLARLDSRATPAQREELLRWDDAVPHAADTVNAVRNDVDDAERLRARVARFAVAAGKRPSQALESRIADVPFVISQALAKPAVASAIVWTLVGSHDEDFASHLIQILRERAGLTRLTARVRGEDLADAGAKLPSLVAWFADRQVADACAWLEAVPVAFGPEDAATLERQLSAIGEARQTTPRLPPALFAAFARRAAAFFVELSARNLDPLGFPLSRDVELETEPSLKRRVEIAAWAWRAGHVVAPRGTLAVLGIPIHAPWPWRLELIAVEPGHGASGCLALLLRIVGEGPPTSTSRAPALLFVPD